LLGEDGLEILRAARGERCADRDETRPFQDRHGHDALRRRAHHKREIHVAAFESAVMLGKVELLELEDETRMMAVDRGEKAISHPLRVLVGEEADPDLAGEATSADLSQALDVRGVVEQLSGEGHQFCSWTRQGHRFARALEQLDAELSLERLDLLADGWLGDVELLRGAPEMQLARDSDEVLELAEFHFR
jgi:hypothetical protein